MERPTPLYFAMLVWAICSPVSVRAQPNTTVVTQDLLAGTWEGFSNQGNFIRMTNTLGADGTLTGHSTVVSEGVVLFDQEVGPITFTQTEDGGWVLSAEQLPGPMAVVVYSVDAARITMPTGEVAVVARVIDESAAFPLNPDAGSRSEGAPARGDNTCQQAVDKVLACIEETCSAGSEDGVCNPAFREMLEPSLSQYGSCDASTAEFYGTYLTMDCPAIIQTFH